jgi:hypothetical protein
LRGVYFFVARDLNQRMREIGLKTCARGDDNDRSR